MPITTVGRTRTGVAVRTTRGRSRISEAAGRPSAVAVESEPGAFSTSVAATRERGKRGAHSTSCGGRRATLNPRIRPARGERATTRKPLIGIFRQGAGQYGLIGWRQDGQHRRTVQVLGGQLGGRAPAER